jgi:hypothetical protein
MSQQQAREFVAKNEVLSMVLVKYLSSSADFKNVPPPFRDIESRKEHEYTNNMIVTLLWYMSWTVVFNDATVKEFLKHVNTVRLRAKENSITKNLVVDKSTSVDLFHYEFIASDFLSPQSGLESANSLNSAFLEAKPDAKVQNVDVALNADGQPASEGEYAIFKMNSPSTRQIDNKQNVQELNFQSSLSTGASQFFREVKR